MKVRYVSFLKSAGRDGGYPDHELPEVAFAGRSNCGKSTLINALVGRKRLARVSSTPGRTQLLNFFGVNDRLVLVDLPGFGYAKVPLEVRAAWGPMVESYLKRRTCLKALVILVDARRDPRDEEHHLCEWCARRGLPLVHVATKIDKLKAHERPLRLRQLARALDVSLREVIPFSGTKREGVDDLWRRIMALVGDDAA